MRIYYHSLVTECLISFPFFIFFFFFFFRFSLESLLDNSRRKNTVGRLRFMAVARSLDTFEIDDEGFIIRYLTNRVDERVLSRSTR